jgi:hypothetical protein
MEKSSTLGELEDYSNMQYSMVTSTPNSVVEDENEVSHSGQEMEDNSSEGNPHEVQEVLKVNNEGKTQVTQNELREEKVPDTPSGLISMMRKTIESNTKKRKYNLTPEKSSQKLTQEQAEIADVVFEGLLGIMNDYLNDFEVKLSNRMNVAQRSQKDEYEAALNRQTKEIEMMGEELNMVREQNVILEGRLTRSEKLVEDMREQLLQQQARSMRDNLVFFNIPEQHDENTEAVLKKFLTDEMKVSASDMENIKFDRVHRTGQKAPSWNRIIVAKFNPSHGKDLVLRHAKNLDKSKKFGVNEQLPRELEERKKRLLPKFKEAKTERKNPKWSVDRLIIDNRVTKVERDTIRDINTNTTEVAKGMRVKRAPPMTYNKTSFQGHTTPIACQDDIIPALHAVYADSRVARATHNTYAYRLKAGNIITEHYEDDGDYGAGRQLLKLLKDKNITNRIVCVSSWSGGTHLGRARFGHLVESAKLVLESD